MKKGRLVWLGVGIVLVVLGSVFWQSPKSPNVLALESPPNGALTNFLETEAGIAAYTQLPTTINFFYVHSLFRTIELETNEYIIGSIPVANYNENSDVHAYIHQTGWVLVYYGRNEPTSKVFDWYSYNDTTFKTRLQIALEEIGEALATPVPNISYYHFRYPEATQMMLIVEACGSGSDSFELNLPSDFGYYEGSWSLGGYMDYGKIASFDWDGERVWASNHWSLGYNWLQTVEGTLSSQQLTPDVYHVGMAAVTGGGIAYTGVAIVYYQP